jgi:hypothetical protein
VVRKYASFADGGLREMGNQVELQATQQAHALLVNRHIDLPILDTLISRQRISTQHTYILDSASHCSNNAIRFRRFGHRRNKDRGVVHEAKQDYRAASGRGC